VSITIDNKNAYWLYKRMKPASALVFSVKDEEKAEAIKKVFEDSEIDYTYNRYKEFLVNVEAKTIKDKIDLMNEIHSIRFKLTIEDD
jgi:ribosomal protein L12E/L44/L45/RPP1/RPP2